MAHGTLVAKNAEKTNMSNRSCIIFGWMIYNLEVLKNYATLTCSLKFQLSTINFFLNEVIISKRPYSKLQSSAELNYFFQLPPFFHMQVQACILNSNIILDIKLYSVTHLLVFSSPKAHR